MLLDTSGPKVTEDLAVDFLKHREEKLDNWKNWKFSLFASFFLNSSTLPGNFLSCEK
jgi:hypothetical protein